MRVFVLAAALAAAACTSGAAPAAADKEKELAKLLDDIAAAGKARKYEEVLTLAKKAAELDPKNPAIPYAAGAAHLALRRTPRR